MSESPVDSKAQLAELVEETKNGNGTISSETSNNNNNSSSNDNNNDNDNNSENNNDNSSNNGNEQIMYIQVKEDDSGESIELPCEKDNGMMLTTLTSQFPGASGLRYKNPETNTYRGLRLVDGKLLAPEKGWNVYDVYYCVFPKGEKRKSDDSGKSSKKTYKKCSDLIVLGLPWKMTDQELKTYFEQFGTVEMAQIKKDPKSGQSKGFGFVRFGDYDTQMDVIRRRHNISGRWCDVRIPLSRGEDSFNYQNSEFNRKIFVGRITEKFTVDDLKSYFTKFGEIADVFIPRPFRGFAFVTFDDAEIAQKLCGEEHTINGVSIHVSNAVPKVDFAASGFVPTPPFHRNYHHHNSYGNNNNSNHNNNNNQNNAGSYQSHRGPPQALQQQAHHNRVGGSGGLGGYGAGGPGQPRYGGNNGANGNNSSYHFSSTYGISQNAAAHRPMQQTQAYGAGNQLMNGMSNAQQPQMWTPSVSHSSAMQPSHESRDLSMAGNAPQLPNYGMNLYMN